LVNRIFLSGLNLDLERGAKLTHRKLVVIALRNMEFARVVYWFI